MTARLKSLLYDTTTLAKCILIRNVTSYQSKNLSSTQSTNYSQSSMELGSVMETIVLTVFLPSAGEYALEVYGAPADSNEDSSYFLVCFLNKLTKIN